MPPKRFYGHLFRRTLEEGQSPGCIDEAFDKLPEKLGKENAAIALVLDIKTVRTSKDKYVTKEFIRDIFDLKGGYEGWMRRLMKTKKKAESLANKKISKQSVGQQSVGQQSVDRDNSASNGDENTFCKICLDAQIGSAFWPCKHSCACETCAVRILGGDETPKCPICRGAVTHFETIFIS